MPIGLSIDGANVHDKWLVEPTLASIPIERPHPTPSDPQHLCLDKGYDNPTGHAATEAAGYVPHIRRIGEEKLDENGDKNYPARR